MHAIHVVYCVLSLWSALGKHWSHDYHYSIVNVVTIASGIS